MKRIKTISIFLLCPFIALSCGKFDAQGGLGILQNLIPLKGGVVNSAYIWNSPDNSCYTYRQQIEFGTNHETLYKGTTVSFNMNTRTTSSNVSAISGHDVRIVWQTPSGYYKELSRLGSVWNDSASVIQFRLQSDLPTNSNLPPDGSYFVYYGCSTPTAPPTDEREVYYLADFFNVPDTTNLASTGWSELDNGTGQDIEIISGQLYIRPTADGPTISATLSMPDLNGDLIPDPIPGNFIVEFDWTIPTNIESSWAIWGLNLGDSALMSSTNATAGVGVGLYSCESSGCPPDTGGSSKYFIDNDLIGMIDSNVTGLNSFKMEVNQSLQSYDYYRYQSGILQTTILSVPYADFAVGNLDTLRVGGMNYMSGTTAPHIINNIRIYLNPANPAELTLGALETPP